MKWVFFMKEDEENKILEFKMSDRILLKRLKEEAFNELKKLYYITGGFQDPDPPTEEAIRAFLDGHIEL